MLVSGDEPAALGSLYDADEVWAAYDSRGRWVRRARWITLAVCWVLGRDRIVVRLLGGMDLPELIDISASMANWRHDVHQVVKALDLPQDGK